MQFSIWKEEMHNFTPNLLIHFQKYKTIMYVYSYSFFQL